MKPSGAPSDRGESLIELLVAVMILGVAVVAVVGGITTSIVMSDIHRKEAKAGAYVRAWAEGLQARVATAGYIPCADSGMYAGANPITDTGFDFTIISISFWKGTSPNPWGAKPVGCVDTTASDGGMQKLLISVSSKDGRAEERLEVVVRKPCRPADALCT